MQVRIPARNQGLDLFIIERFVFNGAGKIHLVQAYWDQGSVTVPEGMEGFVPNIDEAYDK
jgi:hypothetical protein